MARRSLPAPHAKTGLLILAALGGLLSPQGAGAADAGSPRIFQCVLADGRKLTSDKPIAECMTVGKPQRELNKDGSEKAIVEAPPTEDEKAERERIRRQRDAERTAQEIEIRRDRDLLKRYPNEAAHAKARERALDDVASSVRSSEARIKLLLQERKPLDDEKEFYVGKSMPNKLKLALDANDAALEAQRSLVQNQQTEIVRVNNNFDTELARLKKLWGGAMLGTVAAANASSAPVTATVARRPASAPR